VFEGYEFTGRWIMTGRDRTHGFDKKALCKDGCHVFVFNSLPSSLVSQISTRNSTKMYAMLLPNCPSVDMHDSTPKRQAALLQ
jgi:hypothetical protein